MTATDENEKPSLETLIEGLDLGLEVLHPGGLQITDELAEQCDIGQGSRVLDVASGTGESACHLAETLGASVVGVDVSESMLERARAKAAGRNLPVDFRKGDAADLPFPDEEFDAAISECTVCLLDKRRVIDEMTRVVKPGGSVGIHDLCWKEDTPDRMKQELDRIEGERPETLEGWKKLLEESGLTDVRTVDRSELIPRWVRRLRKRLGALGQARVFLEVFRRWGFRGLADALESEKILGSPHIGYGIVVGRKPISRARPSPGVPESAQ